MSRYAIVDAKSGVVENCIHWEGAEWKAPDGKYVIRTDQADKDDIWHFDENIFFKIDRTVK